MRRVSPAWAASVAALLAGCASQLAGAPAAPRFLVPGLDVPAAAQALAVGRSTEAEVAALLGPAQVLRFDNGHAVWVYRAAQAARPREAPELVVLFGPDGTVRKLRARPAY